MMEREAKLYTVIDSSGAVRCGVCENKCLIVPGRRGFRVVSFNLRWEGGEYRCPRCGHRIPMRGRYVLG